MKRLSVLFLSITVIALLLSCGEKTPTSSSGGGDYQLQYPSESAMLALVESREFRPPEDLQIQIDRELLMIREQWGDSIPEVLIGYQSPWGGNLVWGGEMLLHVDVDSSLFDGSGSANRRLFDSLLAHLGATASRRISIRPQWLRIEPNEPWYPPAAVDSFAAAKIPGISRIATTYVLLPDGVPFTSIVRRTERGRSVWYFSSECNQEVEFHVFEIRGRRVEFVDELQICLPDQMAAYQAWLDEGVSWNDMWSREQAYIDSVIASAPEWYEPVSEQLLQMYRRNTYYRVWLEGK